MKAKKAAPIALGNMDINVHSWFSCQIPEATKHKIPMTIGVIFIAPFQSSSILLYVEMRLAIISLSVFICNQPHFRISIVSVPAVARSPILIRLTASVNILVAHS